MKRLLKRLDIDQFLIFFLLAVTINQMGHYLSTMQPAGFGWIGYLQAAGIDLAIWRSSWWYRKYTGKKQKRWALLGIVVFSLVSAWYNQGFYQMQMPDLPWWQPWLMGAILPAGVALLSFLYGQKDASKFSTSKSDAAAETVTGTETAQDDQPMGFSTKTEHVRWLHDTHPDLSMTALAQSVGCSASTVTRALNSTGQAVEVLAGGNSR